MNAAWRSSADAEIQFRVAQFRLGLAQPSCLAAASSSARLLQALAQAVQLGLGPVT
jgi:hypothetical protein